MVGGLLLKGRGRRLWKELSPQRCLCSPVRFASQGVQHRDVQWSDIGAPLALRPGPVDQNGGLCSCSHRLWRLLDTMPADACISNTGSCSGGQCVDKDVTKECCKSEYYGGLSCYLHPVYKTSTVFDPASNNSRHALGKTSSKNSVFAASSSSAKYSSSFINCLPQQSKRICSGFWSWRRREIPSPFIQCRSYLSLGNKRTPSDHASQLSEDSVLRLGAADASEVNTDASSLLPEGNDDFDFRNFPALTSSHYQDYERPTQMQVKKRVIWQTKSKLFNTDTKLTEECIPKPRGRAYDFGLGDMLSSPHPPLEAGARPQGGFDTNISLDECEAAPLSEAPSLGSLVFAAQLPMPNHYNRPRDTLEADNGSEISGDDAQIIEDCLLEPLEDEFAWNM